MAFVRKLFKGALASKAIGVVRRQAAKPENQRKARSLVHRLRPRRRR
ncbi:hypothetical protein GCM10023169_33490 [Georgenia halophila]|uniref:Uncharacterized protein n=1 Tax=Georgenia halophila TaxID=620889 RepID=A0ABP8LL10_9MICO